MEVKEFKEAILIIRIIRDGLAELSKNMGTNQDTMGKTKKELETLIKEWDVHILKGKIIIFEEEK